MSAPLVTPEEAQAMRQQLAPQRQCRDCGMRAPPEETESWPGHARHADCPAPEPPLYGRSEIEVFHYWMSPENGTRLCHTVEAQAEEIRRLRSIHEGRTEAPTDAEIDAHAAAGGRWRVLARWKRDQPQTVGMVQSWAPGIARLLRDDNLSIRWWADDAEGCPGPWPEVAR